MLGLILVYWIGKYFYRLAEDYDKSKWGVAFLGVVSFYVGLLLFGFTIGIFAEVFSPGFFDDFNETLLSLIAMPFGLFCCYLLYFYLEKDWKKEDPRNNNSIDEIGKSEV
jgi:hypothetical protein